MNLGTCPFVVYDEATAIKAGEWVEKQILMRLK